MRVLHILTSGEIGGIEVLCKDFALYSKHKNIILLLWGEGSIADEMRSNGTEVINLHTSPRRILYTIKKLVAVCKKKNIEVIVIHHPAPLSHLCLLLIKLFLPQIRRIAYAHSNAVNMCRESERKEKMLRKMILSCSLKKADAIIAISESVKKSIMEIFSTPEEKITVIYNGVDISRFRQGKRVSYHGLRIVFVGRLIEDKGVQIIIETLRNIKQSFYFDIVGDGEYRKTLEKMVCEYGLQNRVTFWGTRSDVTRFLSHADVFVHVPTLKEGFDITVVEAMASGLTCICSNSGGIPELIENGITGYLVDIGSVKNLTQVLGKVIDHYNSQENMTIRENAKKKAEMFSIQNFSKHLNAIMSRNVSEEKVQLVYVGRLIPEKGVQNIIKAMYLLPNQYYLMIVGDGPYREELEHMASDLYDRVIFLGNRMDVPQLLEFADAFVHMPEWEEGFGITVVEALAAGKVCIVANSGAMSEIITDGVDGFIVEKGNVTELVNCIMKLRKEKINIVRENAMQKALCFSMDKYCNTLDKLILRN